MQDSVSHQIQEAAQALLQGVHIPGADISDCLNLTLNQFLTWPFRVGAVCITDTEGNTVKADSAVYTSSETRSESTPVDAKADAVACVIHTFESLGQEELRSGYEHIAAVKCLKRTRLSETKYPVNFAPLGIILSIDSDISIENIAELIILLNKNYPCTEWPDMVVVLTKGTVNYAASFPGESIKGDFILPAFTYFPAVPLYVNVTARGLGLLSMNKMCSLIFMHLMTFSPGTKLPIADKVMEGVLPLGLTLSTYQYNLKSQLVPARNILWERGAIGPLPFRIEDNKGELLSHLQFIPWQDGGVVRLIGKLPLEGILLFLGAEALKAQIMKLSDGAISSILPIGEVQFREMLVRFQRQSNMKVKPEKPQWTISKFADEGTTSRFMNRLFLGILRLRDLAFDDVEIRKEFDKSYQFVFETLMTARSLSNEIKQTLTVHNQKVVQGEICSLRGGVIHIHENIDHKLQRQVDGFLNTSVRVLKDGMQNLLAILQIDIGFLYSKQGPFERGIVSLTKTQPELATYLRETRRWSEPLIITRNDLHKGWMLPKMTYREVASGTIQTTEPQISGQPVSTFVDFMLDRLCCFVEEVSVFALQLEMPSGISITEIPVSERITNFPERFQLTFVDGGKRIWTIEYHTSRFEET